MPCNLSDLVNVGNPFDLFGSREHASRGQTHLRVFTGRALTELARYHGLRPAAERSAGYYPFSPGIARRLAQLDGRHGAFLIHLYEPDPSFTPPERYPVS